MAALDLSPHPLVVGLATALKAKNTGAQRRKAATDAADQAQQVAKAAAAPVAVPAVGALGSAGMAQVAARLTDPNIPELAAFGGYLGGTVKAPPGNATWQILYLDAKLLTWMLVQQDEIIFHQRLDDDNAVFKERDVIWVVAVALVGRSSGPLSPWLSGDFTRAVDFTPPLAGGGVPPQPASSATWTRQGAVRPERAEGHPAVARNRCRSASVSGRGARARASARSRSRSPQTAHPKTLTTSSSATLTILPSGLFAKSWIPPDCSTASAAPPWLSHNRRVPSGSR